MHDSFLPPLKPSSFSYNRLGEAHVNLPLLRNEEVLKIQDQLPFSGENKEIQNSKLEKRNNAFKKKLKAKYKKMVVRQRGELVEYATRVQKKHTDSPYLQPIPPSVERKYNEEGIQANETNYEFQGETVGAPEEVQRNKWQTQLNLTATNMPYHQSTLASLEGHSQTAQAFWGGGHTASLRKNFNSKTQLMASPTFGGGSLLDESWEDQIKGTFRDKAMLNPHLEEHQMKIRVGVQGRKISQSALPTRHIPVSKEIDTSQLEDQYLSVDEEVLEEALKTQRKMLMLQASRHKEYSKTTILQHIGVRESLDSNSGFSGTSRGLITRPSPLPVIQRKVTDGSNISSGAENMSMFPSILQAPSPSAKRKEYLINNAQLASSEAQLPVGVVKTPQFQKQRKYKKDEDQTNPEKAIKVARANHQGKEGSNKKLEHSKSICKHITLQIPIPQQNKISLVPRPTGATSTLSMAPFSQSPLLVHTKSTLQNSSLKRSFAVMTSVKSPSISPTVFQTTGSSLPFDPNLVEVPIQPPPQSNKSPMLLNDSPQHRRSCVFSHKQDPKQPGLEEHDSPTPPYHDQPQGLKPGQDDQFNEHHLFNSTHDNIGQPQPTMLLLNDYTDAMIDQGQSPEIQRDQQSPLLQNIRIVNDLVTQKVKSAFKTNLRLIKNQKYHQRGLDDFEGQKALMNRTSLDFPVSLTVANQFIRLLSKSNKHKLRKFRDADLMHECQPLTSIKPIQRRNPFHNAALVMNQTTNADFEPLDGPSNGRKSTSLKIKIKDIMLHDDRKIDRKTRSKHVQNQQRTLSHFANGNIYSPSDPLSHETSETIQYTSIKDVKKTEESRKQTRNVYSKVATPGLVMMSAREDKESESRDQGISNQEEVAPYLQNAQGQRKY